MVGSSAACVLGDADTGFNRGDIKRRLGNWEDGRCAREDGAIIFLNCVREELRKHWPSLMQSRTMTLFVQKREAMNRESLVVSNCCVRWCPLTERMHKANMRSGHYTLGGELDEEEFRHQEQKDEVFTHHVLCDTSVSHSRD